MLRKLKAWLLAAVILGASPLAAQEVRMYQLQEFNPTEFHESVYSMMAYCTGIPGDYEAVRWYISSAIVSPTQIEYWGVWFESWGWPAIVLTREKVFDGEIVSHEVMHDLYKGQGPMDKYRMCVLDWENLQPVLRFETEEDPTDERPRISPPPGSSNPTMRPQGR